MMTLDVDISRYFFQLLSDFIALQPIFGYSGVIFMFPQWQWEVRTGMFELKVGIHILSMFWFQTRREN